VTTRERELLIGTQAHALSAMNVPYYYGYVGTVTAKGWSSLLWIKWRLYVGEKS
jgi:hypothetical protein